MRQAFQQAHPAVQLCVLILLGFGAMFVCAAISLTPFFAMGYDLDVLSSAKSLTPENSTEIMMLNVLQLAQALGLFMVPYLIFRWLIKDHTYSVFKLRYIGLNSVLIFAAAMFAAFPLVNYLAEWNAGLEIPIESINTWVHETEKDAEGVIRLFLQMDSIGDLIFNLFLIGLIPAISEELLFRGTMQPLMLKTFKQNYHVAIWATAFLFSFLHLQFLGFFPRMLLGAILGYAAQWSGSLVLPMIGHFVNNGLAVLVAYYIGVDALDADFETLGSDANQWQLVALSTLLLLGGMWLIYRRSSFMEHALIKDQNQRVEKEDKSE